jgi:hypothetical protein
MTQMPTEVDEKVTSSTKGVEGDASVPFFGCLCCFNACYLVYPNCVGCVGHSDCLCIHQDMMSCKIPIEEEDKHLWCICQRGQCVLSEIVNLCAIKRQCFCFDTRCSLPPSDEIPCLLTICFFTICYQYKTVMEFMKPISELEKAANAK